LPPKKRNPGTYCSIIYSVTQSLRPSLNASMHAGYAIQFPPSTP
jgi:hypothetical protein